ncbi:DUF2071 domain-containing protein [Hymenobacter metallilatus]|uniref:DUF2071 domain-containing protein n=1 Tax=Hymenobacter metallilatus TaxID=2493666 RepID=A0A3R9MKK9_9BACT|nr:DUF2071 domain-containing protein [Hymenobacter metallilatus]RSK34032.1 hypothetical protein EI290_10035 [Hymenobacter metallilatus]
MTIAHHPFGVEALLSRTTVLTFAAPAAELQRLLPPCLTLDTLDDTWGFVAVALVQTRQLRPQGLPAWLGHQFFLIGYRIFVRYTTAAGKRLRGLYILGSETDKRHMQWLGNLLTSYRYRTVDIYQAAIATGQTILSRQAGLCIEVENLVNEPELPAGSPFRNWQQARRFAGPLPFTFSWSPATKQVVIVEGIREEWQPQPVRVVAAEVAFIRNLGLGKVRLASAFTMQNIPYRWKKGRTETWAG